MVKGLRYWISRLSDAGDDLDRDAARHAIVSLLVQEEINWRLQYRLFDDGELRSNTDGWPSISPVATLGSVGRSTAPGYSPFERMLELFERPMRRQRHASAKMAEEMLSCLRPRSVAAVLLCGWQLEAPRRPIPADAGVTCPRELTIDQVWQLQEEIGRRLQLPEHKPFPSRKALYEAGLRARQQLILVVDGVCRLRSVSAA